MCQRSAAIHCLFRTLVLLAVVAPALSVRADDDIPREYRLTTLFQHPIRQDLTGFGQFEFGENPQAEYQAYELIWPGLTYSVEHWLQLSGGFLTRYTDNEQRADTLELRPFAGVKVFAPNAIKWTIYNYTRYEYRDTLDLNKEAWSSYSRLRSRFGVEFPLTSRERAWQPRTWYGLADVEPIYRFDHDTVDPLYVRGGIGYVISDRVRVEFIYYAQFTHPAGSSSLQYADNILQLQFKIGLAEGLLRRLHNPHAGD
jgi:Protein of unknown function (DUF2490)